MQTGKSWLCLGDKTWCSILRSPNKKERLLLTCCFFPYTMSSVHEPMSTPCRFDVILDGVGRETEQWALGLLKPWSGAKYVTLVTPLLQDTDSLGLLSGTFQAGFNLHNTAFQVNTSGSIIIWCGNSTAVQKQNLGSALLKSTFFLKQFNLATLTLQTAFSVIVNNGR